MSRRRSSLLLLVVALVVPACGLGDKQAHAEKIHSAVSETRQAKTGRGLVAYTLTPDPDGGRAAAASALGPDPALEAARAAALAPVTLSVEVDFDFSAREALLLAAAPPPPEPQEEAAAVEAVSPDAAAASDETQVDEPTTPAAAPGEPTAIFKSDTIFVKRTKLRQGERRTWAKLDYRALPDDEQRPPGDEYAGVPALIAAANTLNPTFLIELAGGVLAGSVKVLGPETLELKGRDGTPTSVASTRYDANVSVDRALTELDLSEEVRATRELQMRLLLGSYPGDLVRPASFWLDAEGRLRQATFEFSQFVSRNESRKLDITLTLAEYGAPVTIAAPVDDETVQVERYGRMIRAGLPSPR